MSQQDSFFSRNFSIIATLLGIVFIGVVIFLAKQSKQDSYTDDNNDSYDSYESESTAQYNANNHLIQSTRTQGGFLETTAEKNSFMCAFLIKEEEAKEITGKILWITTSFLENFSESDAERVTNLNSSENVLSFELDGRKSYNSLVIKIPNSSLLFESTGKNLKTKTVLRHFDENFFFVSIEIMPRDPSQFSEIDESSPLATFHRFLQKKWDQHEVDKIVSQAKQTMFLKIENAYNQNDSFYESGFWELEKTINEVFLYPALSYFE